MSPDGQIIPIIIVTGLSGAGKSTALNALEDMGFETIDNLPIALLTKLLQTEDNSPFHDNTRPLAIGVDLRTRAFSVKGVSENLATLRENEFINLKMLYMDCDDSSLEKRFSETRRRHPLAVDRPVIDGISDERQIMENLKTSSDVILDTSGLSIHDTKRRLKELFRQDSSAQIMVECLAFGFSKGVPRNADLIFDVRFLRNPHYDEKLQPKTGQDEDVANYISEDENFEPFFKQMSDMILSLLPLYRKEGKSYLTIGFGCTGGRHRSVFTTGKMGDLLKIKGYKVNVSYRDL